ncbi:MAG: 16S rRNA (guanine(966)-N(2))-methyltransferase RsmD [Steroidobacteraceae bacterium]
MGRIVASAHRRGSHSRLLRIIGGAWRGRRLRFPAAVDIRPTPDRVRETLFNWLGGRIVGARCLDLFAGSGALGLEALSRRAAHVDFIEQDAIAARELARLLEEWGARNAVVRRGDALRVLAGAPQPFDLVFVDPPFSAGLVAEAAGRLESRGWLGEHALIYVECAARDGLPRVPGRWALLKSKRAGEVGYHLFERATGGTP